ncbi:MAG TPA: hypothetical protein VLH56_05690 [Dissulfurispiraceae bacterium]|nr:hypothetical protein [Dissulfurispiraceae bacterium]
MSASIAFSALNSWIKPIIALRTTIAMMAAASVGLPTIPAMIPAAIRTMIRKSLN